MNKIKENLIYIIILILIIMNIALNIYTTYIYSIKKSNNEITIENQNESSNEKETENINEVETNNIPKYVEIKGQVENPGVYSIIDGNIINDIVNMAGGFTSKAYTKNINLSKKVEDEMVIYIYSKSEIASNTKVITTNSTCSCPTYDISSCVEQKETTITNGTSGDSSLSKTTDSNSDTNSQENELININTDNLEKLMTLSGIGEAKAKNIIEYRETNGPFTSIEDIQKVSGISTNIYEKIKNYITI